MASWVKSWVPQKKGVLEPPHELCYIWADFISCKCFCTLFMFHASAAFKAGHSKFLGRGENLIWGIQHFMGGIANPLETMDMFKSSIFSKNLKMAFNFNFKTCFHTFNFIIFQRIIFTQMSAFFESVFF